MVTAQRDRFRNQRPRLCHAAHPDASAVVRPNTPPTVAAIFIRGCRHGCAGGDGVRDVSTSRPEVRARTSRLTLCSALRRRGSPAVRNASLGRRCAWAWDRRDGHHIPLVAQRSDEVEMSALIQRVARHAPGSLQDHLAKSRARDPSIWLRHRPQQTSHGCLPRPPR
jgi:hypothetical protein